MISRPLGKTDVQIPRIVFGTSCLGNLYRAISDETKLSLVSEMFHYGPAPVVIDTAGKYGAGLALESLGACLRKLAISPDQVVISNKLGWHRVPLRSSEPTFERGVWAGISHDAEPRISYRGIMQCWEQGCELLGPEYAPQMVSVHDPDEYLAGATDALDRSRRFDEVLGAYQALFELKQRGVVKAVGVGAKDWRVIREITEKVSLDWAMFACSVTVYSHPQEVLEFISELSARGVGVINSAVFHAGFLTGGEWFDYRRVDPSRDAALLRWRDAFWAICRRYGVNPAEVCVQFGLRVPGILAVALNTQAPERIRDNVASVQANIPDGLWQELRRAGLVQDDLPGGLPAA